MWFSGKRFRRTRCENIDELLAATNANEHIVRMLKVKAPVVCYTAVDGDTIKLDLDIDGKKILSHIFKLGEEQEMEKKDGNKMAPQKSCIALAKCSPRMPIYITSKNEYSDLDPRAPVPRKIFHSKTDSNKYARPYTVERINKDTSDIAILESVFECSKFVPIHE
ncbi:jg17610 [Pararge aegeria aegeria]|uniref:Jg17610 protein n=1 Tax=Pararge aegeria aegeria TaxID=348720 RepID=A0A8S4SBZ0_9NEOP|nr:jg17610 [Pararge aegeria aegeria]